MAGGDHHDTHAYGEKQSRIVTAGSGTTTSTWSGTSTNPGLMADWRWYPTATTLRDGRVLVTGGFRPPHHRVFGGRRGTTAAPASPSWGDTLSRFVPAEGGAWDARVLPAPDPEVGRPDTRYAHSGVEMAKIPGFNTQVYFGGIGSDGQPLNDAWSMIRGDSTLGPDYVYKWRRLNPSGTPPAERSDHTAVAALGSMMVVYGGLDLDSLARSDVWRLSVSGTNYTWSSVSTSGTPPAARFGHVAGYDETAITGGGTRKRMIVFGGASAPGQTPTDPGVWELRWDNPADPDQATWYEMALHDSTTPRPAPRYWHSLTHDPHTRTFTSGAESMPGRIAWLYGGALGGGTYSDSLWALWILPNGKVQWRWWALGPASDQPGPRARHSMSFDAEQAFGQEGRLYLLGGVNASGPADSFVYRLDPFDACWNHACTSGSGCSGTGCGPVWSRWDDYEHTLSGHTTLLELSTATNAPTAVAPSFARLAETYDPASNTYLKHANAGLLTSSNSYPLTFVVPGGQGAGCRVVTLGRSGDPTHYLDIPDQGSAGSWVARSASSGTGFGPEAAAMYRPGRVMVAGEGGVTKSANVAIDTSWRTSASMLARHDHNLVLLPDGKVLVVGGADDGTPVKRPQIWDPDGNSGAGTWTPSSGSDALSLQGKSRAYHSTAILLPDGRVLSAGGESGAPPPPGHDKYFAEIFCPPYLFKSDGFSASALRPAINSAPRAVGYRGVFTVCTPDPTRVTRVAMVRPGAATHAFDQNQRYVPLSFTVGSGGTPHLRVTAPASPDSAPPGDYLLFLTGGYDAATSIAYPDLPSIARWVRMTSGGDLFDTVPPGTITDLTPDVVTPNEIWFTWTGTADDGTSFCSGYPQSFHLKADSAAIGNESAWAGASHTSTDASVPGAPGTTGTGHVEGLDPCTSYHFAVRARDDVPQLSALHDSAKFQTFGEGCGGGFSARETRTEHDAARASSREATAATAEGAQAGSGTLLIETDRTPEGHWRVVLREAGAADGVDPGATAIAIERSGAGGVRETLGSAAPHEDQAQLAICSLRDRGRVAIPPHYRLERVTPRLRHRGEDLAMRGAQHSRLGPLGAGFLAEGGAVELLEGDIVELTYAAIEGTAEPAPPWYLVMRRVGAASPSPQSQRPSLGKPLPTEFALHRSEPNPSGIGITLRFELPVDTPVALEVFDLQGRRVATLAQGPHRAGQHRLTWDLRDARGMRLPPGVYLCRMSAGAFRTRQKIGVLP